MLKEALVLGLSTGTGCSLHCIPSPLSVENYLVFYPDYKEPLIEISIDPASEEVSFKAIFSE